MKKTLRLLLFFFSIVLFGCKKQSVIKQKPLKIEVDLNGLSPVNIDSAFVIATKDQQKKKLTLIINGGKAFAESREIKSGTWNLEVQFYTKKETKNLLYQLTKTADLSAIASYSFKCPALPAKNLKTVALDGWQLFYLYIYPTRTIVLPFFSDNPKAEIRVKNPADWAYFYADRVFYNKPSYQNVGSVYWETYNSAISINVVHDNLAAKLTGKTWNSAESMITIFSKDGEEFTLFHVWE